MKIIFIILALGLSLNSQLVAMENNNPTNLTIPEIFDKMIELIKNMHSKIKASYANTTTLVSKDNIKTPQDFITTIMPTMDDMFNQYNKQLFALIKLLPSKLRLKVLCALANLEINPIVNIDSIECYQLEDTKRSFDNQCDILQSLKNELCLNKNLSTSEIFEKILTLTQNLGKTYKAPKPTQKDINLANKAIDRYLHERMDYIIMLPSDLSLKVLKILVFRDPSKSKEQLFNDKYDSLVYLKSIYS